MENELKNKNRFIIPTLEFIVFTNDDIIASSGDFGLGDDENGDDFPNGIRGFLG